MINIKIVIPFMAGLAMSFSACNVPADQKEKPEEENPGIEMEFGDPVETKAPNTDYPSAEEGQTRAPGVKTSAEFTSTILTEELDRPWGLTLLPDGRFLITEKEGYMVIADPEGNLSEHITGIPEVNSERQGGLLGVTIDPDFVNNRMVYWTFSLDVSGGNLTAVAKGRLADDEKSIENAEVIYQAGPAYDGTLHYGSRILIDKEDNIIFSTGERSDLVTRPQAQDLKSNLGKVLRITKDGAPASGNPFLDNDDALSEIYSYGHRNIQALAFHPVTGDLWEGEFGPLGGDEVNLIRPGKNYGWPTITYGLEYSGEKIGDSIQVKEGLEQPVYYYDPSISFSGMTFYDSNEIPEWKNNLFLAALSGQHIARLVIENNKVVGEERFLEEEKQRFRDIAQGADGALYAVTDSGRLYRIGK